MAKPAHQKKKRTGPPKQPRYKCVLCHKDIAPKNFGSMEYEGRSVFVHKNCRRKFKD